MPRNSWANIFLDKCQSNIDCQTYFDLTFQSFSESVEWQSNFHELSSIPLVARMSKPIDRYRLDFLVEFWWLPSTIFLLRSFLISRFINGASGYKRIIQQDNKYDVLFVACTVNYIGYEPKACQFSSASQILRILSRLTSPSLCYICLKMNTLNISARIFLEYFWKYLR